MRRIVSNLLTLLLVFGLLEVIAALLLATVVHSPSEQQIPAEEGNPNSLANSEKADAIREILSGSFTIPHPYLGFVYDPNGAPSHSGVPISPFGFIDDKPPLQKRSPNKVLIGVFGGSVAWWLQALGEQAIREELVKSSYFKNKEIVFIRLALGAYKQPQQLQELSYLLALGGELDIVVNVDGYNDVALFGPNERRFPFFPEYWDKMIGSISSRSELSIIGKIELLKERRALFTKLVKTPIIAHSNLAKLLWTLYDRRLSLRLQILRGELANLRDTSRISSPASFGPELHFPDEATYFEKVATVWKESSLLMKQLSDARGIRYFHFLQPNQYLPGSKNFGEEERIVSLAADSPRGKRVVSGYPVLREAGKELSLRGVRFVDATQVFRELEEAAYNDDCCHLSQRGNDLLGHLVGKTIAETLP